MDRLVAVAAGMSAAVYFIASLWTWCHMLSVKVAKGTLPDRAVAWPGYFALFMIVTLVKLDMVRWTDDVVGIGLLVACAAIYVSALVSVRTITLAVHGNRVVAVFAAVSIAAGLLILLL